MKNIAEAATHYRNFMKALGIDVYNEHSHDTPIRVAKMMHTMTEGLRERDFEMTTFDVHNSVPVVVCNMEFYSLCAHHHAPFFGTVSLAYKPTRKIVGLSKIPRLVKWCSRMPTTQEDLTQDITNQFFDLIDPRAVVVNVKAKHLCVSMRGIENQGSETITSAYAGDIKYLEELRQLMR